MCLTHGVRRRHRPSGRWWWITAWWCWSETDGTGDPKDGSTNQSVENSKSEEDPEDQEVTAEEEKNLQEELEKRDKDKPQAGQGDFQVGGHIPQEQGKEQEQERGVDPAPASQHQETVARVRMAQAGSSTLVKAADRPKRQKVRDSGIKKVPRSKT